LTSVAEIFDLDETEALKISAKLTKISDMHGKDEDRVKAMVLDILKEPDIRTREVMLFTLALVMEV